MLKYLKSQWAKCGQTILKVHFETFVWRYLLRFVDCVGERDFIQIFFDNSASSFSVFNRMDRDYSMLLFLEERKGMKLCWLLFLNFNARIVNWWRILQDSEVRSTCKWLDHRVDASEKKSTKNVKNISKNLNWKKVAGRVLVNRLFRFRAWCKFSGWSYVCKFCFLLSRFSGLKALSSQLNTFRDILSFITVFLKLWIATHRCVREV